MYTWCNTWYNWDCAGTWVILKKKIKIMLLIKTAWYYRKRRLCRGRRRYGNCCHGHADTLLPREVWGTLVESSWERGVLEGRHHLQRTEVATSCCSQGLTLVHLPLDEILWIICAPESQTDFFGTACFHAAHHLGLLDAFIPLKNWKFCKSGVRVTLKTSSPCSASPGPSGVGTATLSPQPLSHAQPKPPHYGFAARWHLITLFL